LPRGSLRVGQFISFLRLDILVVSGIVRWTEDECCGIEFTKTMPCNFADFMSQHSHEIRFHPCSDILATNPVVPAHTIR